MGHAERARQLLHRRGLPRSFRAQTMIDSDGDKHRPLAQALSPARGEYEQRHRIRPAGNRQHEGGRSAQISEK